MKIRVYLVSGFRFRVLGTGLSEVIHTKVGMTVLAFAGMTVLAPDT